MRKGKLGLIAGCAAAVLGLAVVGAGFAPAEEAPLEGAFGKSMQLRESPEPAPEVPVQTPDGGTVRLDEFAGKVVVLNVWATWCAPCVEEMPTLEALHTETGEDVHVMAVSQDRGGMDAVGPFLDNRVDVPELPIYLDPDGELASALDVRAMPTTFVLDTEGRVLGSVEGPLDWNSESVRAFVAHYADLAE